RTDRLRRHGRDRRRDGNRHRLADAHHPVADLLDALARLVQALLSDAQPFFEGRGVDPQRDAQCAYQRSAHEGFSPLVIAAQLRIAANTWSFVWGSAAFGGSFRPRKWARDGSRFGLERAIFSIHQAVATI